MIKQNNSLSTDRPDSSPELYRAKHNKRSDYHNKNSPRVDGKSNNLADVILHVMIYKAENYVIIFLCHVVHALTSLFCALGRSYTSFL